MNNNLTVSELFVKVKEDLDRWESKRQSAEIALKEATARQAELALMLTQLSRYAPEIAVHTPKTEPTGEFFKIGLREGIKLVLQRAGGRPLTTVQIADVLLKGGMKSKSANFRSNVSATLSIMQSKHGEVQKTPQGWILSQPSLVVAASSHEAA